LKAAQQNFRFDSRLCNVTDVAKAARRLCEENAVCDAHAAAVELALVEAVNNAIEHGYQGEPGHELAVEVFLNDSAVHVTVSEQGIGMAREPSGELPPPDQVNGRGWFLIRRCMDEVSYKSERGINTVYMCRYLR